MKVTMKNPNTNIIVTGIDIKYAPKWEELGFVITDYDSDKIVLLKTA